MSPMTTVMEDCLLHRTHHEMGPECWQAVAEFMIDSMKLHDGQGPENPTAYYRWFYEQALFGDIVIEGYEETL